MTIHVVLESEKVVSAIKTTAYCAPVLFYFFIIMSVFALQLQCKRYRVGACMPRVNAWAYTLARDVAMTTPFCTRTRTLLSSSWRRVKSSASA